MDAVPADTDAVKYWSNEMNSATPSNAPFSPILTPTPAAMTPVNPDPSPVNVPVKLPVLIWTEELTNPSGLS